MRQFGKRITWKRRDFVALQEKVSQRTSGGVKRAVTNRAKCIVRDVNFLDVFWKVLRNSRQRCKSAVHLARWSVAFALVWTIFCFFSNSNFRLSLERCWFLVGTSAGLQIEVRKYTLCILYFITCQQCSSRSTWAKKRLIRELYYPLICKSVALHNH